MRPRHRSKEAQIQPAEEIHDQIVDEGKTLILGNAHIPSSNETQTLTVEETEIKAIAETPTLSTEETKTEAVDATKTQISSAKQTQTQTCAKGTKLDGDESQIQSIDLAQTAEYMKNWLTENSEVRLPEENQSPNAEESEPQMLEGKDGYLIKTNYQSLSLSLST